jgi:hypothetical protein
MQNYGMSQGEVMSEAASVEVLSAEVRVLQVGNGQITRSMYRQLDEAAFERFEPNHLVPGDQQVTNLDQILLKAEGPAILGLTAKGAVEVLANGLQDAER